MYKISANIVCKDEVYWIKESILSIVYLLDEIIYVDDRSKDGSLEIVKELANNHSNIKIFEYSTHGLNNLCDLKNYAMNKSKNKMVIRWDADFIAYEEIEKLFSYCLENSDTYDAYVLKAPNLHGDINHFLKGKEHFGPEVCLYKKDKMQFEQTDRYNDYPIFDEDTKYCYPHNTALSRSHFFVHTNKLKSCEKLAYRKRMTEYQMSGESHKSYWKWLGEKTNLTPEGVKDREVKNIKNEILELEEIDFEKWGKHPEILTKSKSCESFKIEKFDSGFKIVAP
jgi:glycosyltransferase involved in cell wall biosynthesis